MINNFQCFELIYIFQRKPTASMNATIKFPFYAKVSLIFLGFFAFVSMLFIGQRIIVPVIYATILAIVLSPAVDWFVKRKINRIIAITITLLLVIVLAFSIIAFLCSQVSKFTESFPIMISKLRILLDSVVLWISDTFHVRSYTIESWLIEMKNEILNDGKSAIGETLIYTGNALVILVLIPVYIFMILYYQPLLLEFIYRLFKTDKAGEVNEVLLSTKRIIQSYLVGLLIEAFLIASLNSISLLILGIDYAILLGVIGAIVNIIPYIGGVLGVALPFVMALTTKPSFSYAFMVLCAYIIIQFIDNHYIVPKIVASKVKINALVSVIVVLTGSALWGIPGMLISIPLTAIIKVICDHIEGLKPWGFLLGDTMSVFTLTKFHLKK
jgi:predicted PurR-regulated permease PerM